MRFAIQVTAIALLCSVAIAIPTPVPQTRGPCGVHLCNVAEERSEDISAREAVNTKYDLLSYLRRKKREEVSAREAEPINLKYDNSAYARKEEKRADEVVDTNFGIFGYSGPGGRKEKRSEAVVDEFISHQYNCRRNGEDC